MAKVSQEVLAAVKDAFQQYQKDIQSAPLAPQTKKAYVKSAVQFVHWMEGKFEPGRYQKRGMER